MALRCSHRWNHGPEHPAWEDPQSSHPCRPVCQHSLSLNLLPRTIPRSPGFTVEAWTLPSMRQTHPPVRPDPSDYLANTEGATEPSFEGGVSLCCLTCGLYPKRGSAETEPTARGEKPGGGRIMKMPVCTCWEANSA